LSFPIQTVSVSDMPLVLVHGNPETSAVWDTLAPLLSPNPIVRLSPPGFGAPLPHGFTNTVEEYRRWLIGELEKFDEPVDIVGHDWGGSHVMNVAMTRPDLLRSWVCDTIGIFDEDYQWHDLAQTWVTPGDGERAVARMVNAPIEKRTADLVELGMHHDVAVKVAEGQNDAMGQSILRLYRDAAQPTMARLGEHLENAAARPGLSILTTEDHRVGTDDQRARAARRAGAQQEVLDGLGHWWFSQDPDRAAKILNSFWDELP
jgi:pimeloyl-ACP methyl ester carboxylesterase